MKATIIMLVFILVFLFTYFILGFIGYILSTGLTYKYCLTSGPLFMIMFAMGWIPAVIVCIDLDKYLD